jgi:hypothetical protein
MALGSTQPLTKMRTTDMSCGVKVASAQDRQLYHIHMPTVLKFLEPQCPGALRDRSGL